MKKVYCGECKWYNCGYLHYADKFYSDCNNPNNLKDTPIISKSEQIQHPKQKNKNNDCKLFQPKPKTFLEKLFKL